MQKKSTENLIVRKVVAYLLLVHSTVPRIAILSFFLKINRKVCFGLS